VAACIAEAGIGFMFAPMHHRAMRCLAPVRRDLGIRTVFNFLGPLANPAGARRQLVGVSDARYVAVLAEALAGMATERALVVHGGDGLDEISVCDESLVTEVAGGVVVGSFTITPEDLGLRRWPLEDLRGGDPLRNADITRTVLEGRPGAALDVTLANAGAALYVAGAAESIAQGVAAARESVASGRAQAKVAALVSASRKAAGRLAGRV
jgi:anthranilate phosphoribosyltransferase